MAFDVLIHLRNEDSVLAEMEEMPDLNASYITCAKVRKKDGKPESYLDTEAASCMFPWSRITLIEAYPSDTGDEDIEYFFRD